MRSLGIKEGLIMKKRVLVFLVGFLILAMAWPVYAVDLDVSGEFQVRGFYFDNLVDGFDEGAGGVDCSAFSDSTTDCDDQKNLEEFDFLRVGTSLAHDFIPCVQMRCFSSQTRKGRSRGLRSMPLRWTLQ